MTSKRSKESVMNALGEIGVRELDRRCHNGIDVRLLWNPRTNRLYVTVEDDVNGDSFEVGAPAAEALEVFRHPYAYAKPAHDDYALAS